MAISTLDLDGLLAPVIHRAHADLSASVAGFSDRWAELVLQRLGFRSQFADSRVDDGSSHKAQIARCAWIDTQLLSFFAKSPYAEGVEINGGLSTRFHRISAMLDWPRFSWMAINSFEVNDCIQFTFPEIDNYRRIGCETPEKDWRKYILWSDAKPKILVFGEQHPINCWDEFIMLYQSIREFLSEHRPDIDVIISHKIPEFSVACEMQRLSLKIIEQQNHKAHYTSFWKRLFSWRNDTYRQQQKATTVHLNIF